MITIDAIGKDGNSILPDLQSSSPTGGFYRTEWRTQYDLQPGDVVRQAAGWCVVGGLAHDGVLGLTTLHVIDQDNLVHRSTLALSGGAEVRMDARVDPDTLYKLGELKPAATQEA